MGKIENHKYTIEEAFRDCFYIVPDYQREYIWSDKEVNKLLEDIDDEIDGASTSEYFIGTVLVSPTNLKNHFDVIDGQQRLTTFFLILCALRALFKNEPQEQTLSGLISTSYTTKEGEINTSIKLSPRYEYAEEIMNIIVNANEKPQEVKAIITASGVKQFGSLENLINAYNIVFHFLETNYKENGKLKKYWGYLSNNVIFIQISTDVSSALKIFETINERGVGLNPMDLLKNLLFTHVKLDEFNKLKDEWKKITKPLEEHKEKPLRFLRYFLMANYKIVNDRGDSTVREDEIYDWFTKKSNAELCNYKNEPFVFVRKIINSVDNFIDFSQGKGNDNKNNLFMNNIRKLCGGAFSLHYVLLLASSTLPKELFDYLLKQLETFLFYYIITRTATKELERNFSNWADELRIIVGITDPNDQKTKLNDFIIEKLQKNANSKDVESEDALKRYNFYSLQQYRTRYILAKMTQYVDMAYKGIKSPGSLDEYTVLEIEHILPNNPEKELRNDFSCNNKDKEYDEYKMKLGNLTLLEKPINIVAGRKYFEEKTEEYKKSKNYLTSSIAELNAVGNNSSINRINQKLKSFDTWDANTIDERQSILIRLSNDIWKIEPFEIE